MIMDDHYQTGHSSTKVMAEILLRAAWVSVCGRWWTPAIASQGKFVPRGSFTQSSAEAQNFTWGNVLSDFPTWGGSGWPRVVDKTGKLLDELRRERGHMRGSFS